MSLLEARMSACVRLLERDGAVSDGLGGTAARYVEGPRFEAALVYGGTEAMSVADRKRPRDGYAVLTRRDVALGFHDVFRRVADGAVFRVTSSGRDCATPEAAGLDLRAVKAELWEVPV